MKPQAPERLGVDAEVCEWARISDRDLRSLLADSRLARIAVPCVQLGARLLRPGLKSFSRFVHTTDTVAEDVGPKRDRKGCSMDTTMPEALERARALLADVATDGVDIPRALDVLAALCDENDALERRLHLTKKVVKIREESNHSWAAENDALLAERDALRAELAQEAALRAELAAEVKRLKAGNAVLDARVAIVCECVKSRQGPMGGSIARPLPGCDECGGTGGIIVDGDA